MYCPNCASSIEPGQTVCPRCGSAVAIAAAPPMPSIPAARPDMPRWGLVIVTLTLGEALISTLITVARFASYLHLRYYLFSFVDLGIWVIVLTLAWRRHGWARFGMVAMLVWSFGNLGWAAVMESSQGGVLLSSFIEPVLNLLVTAAGVALLFTPGGNRWFSNRTSS